MSRPPYSHPWPDHNQRAFTLVEIAVVVMILGLLISLALPGYRKITLKSRATAVVSDLRTFSAAFGGNSMQNGSWIADTGVPGEIPPGMVIADGKEMSIAFTRPTPIGGKYLWVSNDPSDSTYGKAAIAITTDGAAQLTDDLDLLEMVDRMIDDGDLSSGNLQRVGPALVYVLEK